MSNISKNSDELFFETEKMTKQFSAHPNLKMLSNFSFDDEDYPKKKTKELLNKVMKEINERTKLTLLKECLRYDNTNEDAILENLKLTKDKKGKKIILEKYGYYLSQQNFQSCFGKAKKGVIELYKELFILFEKYRKKSIDDIKRIWNFVEEFITLEPLNIFVDESNLKGELFIHFIYLVQKIWKLIIINKKKVFDTQISFEDKLKKFFKPEEQQDIKNQIESFQKYSAQKYKLDDINNSFILSNFKIFKEIFPSISILIGTMKEQINYCLDNLDDSNLYFFICIQELILNYLMENGNFQNKEFQTEIINYISNKMKKSEPEKSIKDYIQEYNDKSGCIKIEIDKDNINNLIFKYEQNLPWLEKKVEILKLKNAYIYDWKKIINDNSTLYINFEIPLEYQFLEFIKIEYIKEFNFIKYTYGFIEELLINISKSNTMISLLNEIYSGCDTIFNEKSDFINNLIKKVLSRCYYFRFFSYKRGYTITHTKRICFFLEYTYNKSIEPKYKNNFIKFLIVNLGLFVYIFFHEFFGHFLFNYLEILTKNKYNSPFSIIENKNESGRFIEAKLFGKRINEFNIYQLLYIIDIDNYKNDYKTFNLNFQNVGGFNASESLYTMFKKHFNIEFFLQDEGNTETFKLFGNNIEKNKNNEVFTVQDFRDCLPLENNKILYNLLILEKGNILFPIMDD